MTPGATDRGVELRHLRALVAVVEELNFTRAAERLQITQPALSRTIAALERRLDSKLLVRDRRSVRLTPQGRDFVLYAERVLVAMEEALGSTRSRVPAFRVGFTWGSTAEYTAPTVRAFEKEYPQVEVIVHRYDDTVAGLADGRSHVGFLPGMPSDDRLGTLVLAEEPRVAALPLGHRLTEKETVRLAELGGESIVVNVVSGTTSLELWEPGHRPTSVVEVSNVDDWMEAIAADRGIGLTPAATGRMYSHPEIRWRVVTDAPLVPIVLAWPRRAAHPLVPDFVAVAGRAGPHTEG